MALLKEDGSLDVERINRLPIMEFMDEMGNLTSEQVEEYLSKSPLNEAKQQIQPIKANFSIREQGALFDDIISELRKKHRRK